MYESYSKTLRGIMSQNHPKVIDDSSIENMTRPDKKKVGVTKCKTNYCNLSDWT